MIQSKDAEDTTPAPEEKTKEAEKADEAKKEDADL